MKLGTRASALALAQARIVADLLGGAEIVPFTTTGDRESAEANRREQAVSARGDHSRTRTAEREGPPGAPAATLDKSRWVLELERALSSGEIDLAVHSAKDVPGEIPEGLALLGAPARAAAEDLLCGVTSLQELPAGARVGTSSVRRAAQLRAAREDIEVVAIRGNVDTRLRKLRSGESGPLHAVVLARAGLQRLGLGDDIPGTVLDPIRFVPSPGQGILALEGRADDARARSAAEAITDPGAFAALLAERAVAKGLSADCHTPLGAHAVGERDGRLRLLAWVGLPDGSAWILDEWAGEAADPDAVGVALAERLRSVGAAELLARAREGSDEQA